MIASDVMTRNVISVAPDATVADAVELMLERGIYLAPSQFEAAFFSAAHTDDDVIETVAAAREAFALVNA